MATKKKETTTETESNDATSADVPTSTLSEQEQGAQELSDPSAPVSEKLSADEQALHDKTVKELKRIKQVGDTVADKLFSAGYYTVDDVASTTVGDLVGKTGMPKATAETVIANALSVTTLDSVEECADIYKAEQAQTFLSTGSPSIDATLLHGGYRRGIITELHAQGGMGKTQSAITAAVMATRPLTEGGLATDVIYVDTEGSFTVTRLRQIAIARSFDPDEVQSHVHLLRCKNTSRQLLTMETIRAYNAKHPVRLVIVDSVISLFRAEFIGRGTLQDRQSRLNRYLHDLSTFARNNDAVVLITNQMMANPEAMFASPYTAVGGLVLNHACQCRLYLRSAKQNKVIMRLEKSPYLPDGEAVACINQKGLCDAA